MLDKSVSYFLSQYWRNQPLYAEKIIPLLDTVLSSNFILSDKVADAFYELTNKYQNTAELPLENLKEFIREQGYGYILDLVVQDEDTVKLLWYMLVLIHQLKGSKDGILLVLSLFEDNFDPNKTTITEWHEMNPVGRPHTFSLETTVNLAKLGDGFFKKFETFLANYVYPEMLAMKINYSVDGRITYRPYAKVKINSKVTLDMKDGYNGGKADLNNIVGDVYDGGGASTDYSTSTYLTETEVEIDESTGLHYPVGLETNFTEDVYEYDAETQDYIATNGFKYLTINGGGAYGTTWKVDDVVKGWTRSTWLLPENKVYDYTTLAGRTYNTLVELGIITCVAPNNSKFMYQENGVLKECVFNE